MLTPERHSTSLWYFSLNKVQKYPFLDGLAQIVIWSANFVLQMFACQPTDNGNKIDYDSTLMCTRQMHMRLRQTVSISRQFIFHSF